MGFMEANTIIIIGNRLKKVYLKCCRWCKTDFYTHQPNKLYCSAMHQYEAKKESWRKARGKQRQIQKRNDIRKENLKDIGTFKFKEYQSNPTYLGTTSGQNPQIKTEYNLAFYNEWESTKDALRKTFRTGNGKGKQKHKSTLTGATFSPHNYQFVTDEDIHNFSISYLKDNQFKCPECGNRTHLIEHALAICSNTECGLVLKAPSIHVGFEVDDLLPIKKIAATPNDFPPIELTPEGNKRKSKSQKVIKQAHENAYKKYQEQLVLIDAEVENEDLLKFSDNDPLNPIYWRKRKKSRHA